MTLTNLLKNVRNYERNRNYDLVEDYLRVLYDYVDLEIIKEKYVDAYICASKMAGYIQRYHKYNLSDEELLYLTIHVAKVVNKN